MTNPIPNSAALAVLCTLDMTRHDEIIPIRGEPFVDEATGITHIRFVRPGVPGEFHLQFKVDYMPPFRRPE